MLSAWGFASSTKIEASLDVLTLHGTVIASRSKWVQELVASFGQKEEETLEPGRVSADNSHQRRHRTANRKQSPPRINLAPLNFPTVFSAATLIACDAF